MKRTYSKEYKIKACQLVVEDGIKAKVVAEKLGINVVMLYRWIGEYETDGAEAFVGKGHLKQPDAELRNAFTLQASPKYADFPYVASKAISGVTAAMAPFVVLSPSDATSGNFCPVVEAYSGGIYIYAHSAPSSAITIPFILCMAGQGTLTGMSNSNGFLATVLSFTSKTVAVSDWVSDTTYTDFPYRAAVSCEGVTAKHYAEVALGLIISVMLLLSRLW